MPTSDAWGKDWVAKRIEALSKVRPIYSAIDVGAGSGTYSDLLRSILPNTNFCAIEAWGPYVSEFNLEDKYDDVIVGDIRYINPEVYCYDSLVIFGDVLEHVSRTEAMNLLELARNGTSQLILICVPMLHLEQGAVNGNPFEIHKMENHFSEKDILDLIDSVFGEYGRDYVLDTHIGDVVGYFLVRTGKYADRRYDEDRG